MLLRYFTWADLPIYAALHGTDGGAARAEQFLRQPNLDAERDCTIAEAAGQAAGYALVIPELAIGRAVIQGAVHSGRQGQGFGTALLARAIAHSTFLGAKQVHVSARAGDEAAQALFEGSGFSEVSRQWQMGLSPVDYHPPKAQSAGAKPRTAYAVRPMASGEEGLLAALQNQVFSGSFGFAPNRPEELAYRLRMDGGRPEDIHFLFDGPDALAYCWTRLSRRTGDALGEIAMIGAIPAARGRGAGGAVLREGLDSLFARGASAIELTVYQDNVPAIELYRAVGFRKLYEIVWWERHVPGT